MHKTTFYFLLSLLTLSFLLPSSTQAHVTVKPAEVGIAAFQTFTMNVPVEKELGTIQVRLIIPKELAHVTPNVKNGWYVEVIKNDDAVSEIIWSGGYIPPGQRDEFVFSAQAPNKEASINWKAYQTYEDWTVVSWDQEPQGSSHEGEDTGPYSITKVVNDLDTPTSGNTINPLPNPTSGPNRLPLFLSTLAIIASGFSIWLQISKGKKKK